VAHTWKMTTTYALRRHRIMHVIIAGAAGIAMLAFADATHLAPGTGAFGHVRVVADDSDDEAQLQQQLNQQQLLISEQQSEQQNEAAEQQFEQGMQEALQAEQQANNP
jgi:preprotein translocase subunit SecF